MASKARGNFDKNCEDVQRLLEIHTNLGGTGQGRRYQLEVLNKSAVVLICAIWEAYCEDLVAEAVAHIVKHADVDSLSDGIKKLIAKEIKDDKHELSAWDLAGDGWKGVMTKRLAKLQEQRNRKLNTPKANNIKEFFNEALGIKDITTSWRWKRMLVASAKRKLDKYVELRGAIAHRGTAGQSCTKDKVRDFLTHVTSLVGKTGGSVNSYVKKITDKKLW